MSNKALFTEYFKKLHQTAQQGDAREESFYSVLAGMLEAVAEKTGRKQVHVTTLPKATDAGNPDFRLWNGINRIVGYIEAKKPTEERLDAIEESEQLTRYRSTFPNLILTNFLEFRLYRNGERVQTVLAARPFAMTRLRTAPVIEKADDLQALLERFLDFSLPQVFTAESLAVELAKRTRFLRDEIARQLVHEENEPGVLTGFFEAFQTYLIGTLTPEDFADLFAQTITYGLFAARTRSGTGDAFSRRAAFHNIPHTIGVLRDLFQFISLGDLPEQLAWCVDDIAEVLAVADAPGILDRYYHEGKGSDPIVHFYETFLAQYDPDERKRRGVYYTPEPVVGYIIRSLHGILKTDFGKYDGLASDGVTLLDPAAGTMTFIARAAEQAVAEFVAKYGEGGRADFIRNHILKNFYAFELMMAPYAVGHLKMSFFLEELGHRLTDDERVPFYLTNTLDNEELEQSHLPGFSALAAESRLAGTVKKQTPILVILGNPPYSGHSTNTGDWIRNLIDDYKMVDGMPLGESNPRWLQDDYVKFIRFAQWKVQQAGRGLVGMITNHGYLDNPTFRGMRRSLMQTFDEIYVLDLHGNTLKKETCQDGSADKNVFDIRQGVAICFFIKNGRERKSEAVVHHAELWGQRASKYDWLNATDIEKTDWQKLIPKSPSYLFITRDETHLVEYEAYCSVRDLFGESNTGIIAGRDRLAIQFTKDELWRTLVTFSKMPVELARQSYGLGKDARDWTIAKAQGDLASGLNKSSMIRVHYRPFDIRYTYYTGNNKGFLRWCYPKFTHHMLAGENLALITSRLTKGESFHHAQVTQNIAEVICMSPKTSNNGFLFPLYLYPISDSQDLFAQHESSERKSNLNPEIVATLTAAYGKTPTPEDVFHYIYAVLYSPAYRTKYAEFLKSDFPRIPFTVDAELFKKLATLGEKLVALHLLKSPELNPPTCRFKGEGDNRVESKRKTRLRYDADEERVYINAKQYFGPVPEIIWTYQVGGYQVCEKWLKDRRDRRLEHDDIRTYCRIVTALGRTIELQDEIDTLYPAVEEETIDVTN